MNLDPRLERLDLLAQLVAERVGEGRRMTWRQVEERAVDPETGYRPVKETLRKISRGITVKVSPELVRAVAAGLEVPLYTVENAFIAKYVTGRRV